MLRWKNATFFVSFFAEHEFRQGSVNQVVCRPAREQSFCVRVNHEPVQATICKAAKVAVLFRSQAGEKFSHGERLDWGVVLTCVILHVDLSDAVLFVK
jgi:hypothetical protein